MSPSARVALVEAMLEYLILVLPVAFYVGLESYHRHDLSYFQCSPEWAIATVFLQFQGLYLFITQSKSRATLSEARVGLLALLALTVVVASAMNALDSMHAESDGKIVFRILLFTLTSCLFLTLVASSKYKRKQLKHGQ